MQHTSFGKTPKLSEVQMAPFKQRFGDKKVFAQCLMPIRGPEGFRELDYDFPNQIDPKKIMDKIQENGFNAFALVVKDTDGATIADTPSSWNPSGRDLCGEFSDLCEEREMAYFLSVTNMNDAYRGWQHPETVSVHIKGGFTKAPGVKDAEKERYEAGDIGTHYEGEMRVRLPEGKTYEEMKEKIPFLTEKLDVAKGEARSARGQGYIPLTSFHCPRSEHIDYMITLIKELINKYKVDGVLADYIRYHHGFRDFCGCPRCRAAFAEKYPNKADRIMKCKEWWDFREDNIAEYGRKFNEAIKEVDEDMVTGWFNLPGPKIYSRRFVAQNYKKLGATMDSVIPMVYPYLMGTRDDGWKWRKLADLFHWYQQRNMASRIDEYGKDTTVFCVTNSVECNAEEMLMSCRGYDYGLGISLFKYYGTTEAQWYASKLYSELLEKQKLGDLAPSEAEMREILVKVYEKYPPKFQPKWYSKLMEQKTN